MQTCWDAQLPARTIREYFHILEDTLIGTLIPSFSLQIKRKAYSSAKFFLFDVGVANVLAEKGHITARSDAFGSAFEHFIFTELRAWLNYTRDQRRICYWHAENSQEVDFLIGRDIGIEVKASGSITGHHLKGLYRLGESLKTRHRIIVSLDTAERLVDGIRILPWQKFLTCLWSGEYDSGS